MNLQARTLITSLQGPTPAKPDIRNTQRGDADAPLSFDKAFSAARESRAQPSRDLATQRDLNESLRTKDTRKSDERAKPDDGSERDISARESRDTRSAKSEAPDRPDRPERSQRPDRPERSESPEGPENQADVENAPQDTAAVDDEGKAPVFAESADEDEAVEASSAVTTDEEISTDKVKTPDVADTVEVALVNAELAQQAVTVTTPTASAEVIQATAAPVAIEAEVSKSQVAEPVVDSAKPATPKPVAHGRPHQADAPAQRHGEPAKEGERSSTQGNQLPQTATVAVSANPGSSQAAVSSQTAREAPTIQAATSLPAEPTALTSNASPSPAHVNGIQTARQEAGPQPSAAAQFSPPAEQNLRDDVNMGRVARGLQSAVNQRGGSVTLRLTPPELGAVRIELMVKDGVVNARFTAQQESVRNLLMDQMGHLRTALDRQGLTVERIEVQTNNNASNGSMQQSRQDGAGHDGRSAQQYTRQQSGQGRGPGQSQGDPADNFGFEQLITNETPA